MKALKEKNLSITDVSRSAEEENSSHTKVVNYSVIENMSGGLSFCGLDLTECKEDRRDIKYRELDCRLFLFDGEIELCNSKFAPYSNKFEVNSVQHFKKTVRDVITEK